MNERIRELTEQCMVEVKNVPVTGTDGWTALETVRQIDPVKFAELIVRECIGCCEQVISDPVPKSVDTWLNGGEQCIQEIKEHFGVEE